MIDDLFSKSLQQKTVQFLRFASGVAHAQRCCFSSSPSGGIAVRRCRSAMSLQGRALRPRTAKNTLCDVQTYLEFEVVRKNVPVARRKRCSKCPRKRQDSWQLRDCLFRRHGERSSQRCTTKCSTESFAHSVFSYGSI